MASDRVTSKLRRRALTSVLVAFALFGLVALVIPAASASGCRDCPAPSVHICVTEAPAAVAPAAVAVDGRQHAHGDFAIASDRLPCFLWANAPEKPPRAR